MFAPVIGKGFTDPIRTRIGIFTDADHHIQPAYHRHGDQEHIQRFSGLCQAKCFQKHKKNECQQSERSHTAVFHDFQDPFSAPPGKQPVTSIHQSVSMHGARHKEFPRYKKERCQIRNIKRLHAEIDQRQHCADHDSYH